MYVSPSTRDKLLKHMLESGFDLLERLLQTVFFAFVQFCDQSVDRSLGVGQLLHIGKLWY